MSSYAVGEIVDITQECEGSGAAAILLIADWLDDGERYTPTQRRALRKALISMGFYESYEDEKREYHQYSNGMLRTKFGYYEKPDFTMDGKLYRECKSVKDDLLARHAKQFG